MCLPCKAANKKSHPIYAPLTQKKKLFDGKPPNSNQKQLQYPLYGYKRES